VNERLLVTAIDRWREFDVISAVIPGCTERCFANFVSLSVHHVDGNGQDGS
jgi:hypothetical protein